MPIADRGTESRRAQLRRRRASTCLASACRMAALSRCLPDPDLFAGFMDGADRSSSVDVPGLDSRDAQWDRFEKPVRTSLTRAFGHRPRGMKSRAPVLALRVLLASITNSGTALYVLCFSDDGPDTGPHPISQEELRAAFNPKQWMGCRRHRTGPDSDEIPQRRRTGVVRDN